MRKSRSKQETPPRFFLASLLDHSLLLQPARLKRTLTHWAESLTWRFALQKIRQQWRECRMLLRLTPLEFREHLAKNLQDLPLDNSQRRQALELCKAAPQDPCFWQVIQEAEPEVWPLQFRIGDYDEEGRHRIFGGEYFQERFAQQRKPVPPEWVHAARDVLFVLVVLKGNAATQIQERSHLLQMQWDQGRARALLAAVQEDLPAVWVTQAIHELELQQQESNSPGARRHARAFLKRLEEARGTIGKGNIEHLRPEDRPISKREAVARSKALRRLLKKHQREAKFYGGAEIVAYDEIDEFLSQETPTLNRHQREVVVETFLKKRSPNLNLRKLLPCLKKLLPHLNLKELLPSTVTKEK